MYHKETNNSLIDWRLIFETKGFVEISNLYRDTPTLAPTTHGVGKIGHFGRSFVKRFTLCYQTVVCLSCLSVTFVHCGQTVGRIKMKLDTQDTPTLTQFLVHVYYGQMTGWMKTPLGTGVDLGPSHIVLDAVPAPAKGEQQPPSFRPMSIVATVAHLSYG